VDEINWLSDIESIYSYWAPLKNPNGNVIGAIGVSSKQIDCMPHPNNHRTLAEFLSDFNALYDKNLKLISSFTAEPHLHMEEYFNIFSLEALK